MLLTVWALSWPLLLWDEYALLGKHIVAGVGFALNLVLYQDFNLYFGVTTTPLLHLWSLGVEEQFYIVWRCSTSMSESKPTAARFCETPLDTQRIRESTPS